MKNCTCIIKFLREIGFGSMIIVSLLLLILATFCKSKGKNEQPISENPDALIKINYFRDAPGKYEIENNKDFVIIPFELLNNNKILFHAKINGKKVKLLVDNGKLWDQVWFYNGEVDSLNLKFKNNTGDTALGLGEDGGTTIIEGTDVDISIGDVTFTNQPTYISPPAAGFQSMFPGINGQVSALFFKHFIVKFDFENSVIILTKPERFRYSGNGQKIEMSKRENGSFCLPFTLQIDGQVIKDYLVDIDLGTIFPIHLFENKKMNINLPAGKKKHVIGYGASGKIFGYTGKIDKLSIGKYSFDNVPAEFVEESKNMDIIETGTFGIPLMEKFNIIFDYFNLIVILEPNNKFSKTFNYTHKAESL